MLSMNAGDEHRPGGFGEGFLATASGDVGPAGASIAGARWRLRRKAVSIRAGKDGGGCHRRGRLATSLAEYGGLLVSLAAICSRMPANAADPLSFQLYWRVGSHPCGARSKLGPTSARSTHPRHPFCRNRRPLLAVDRSRSILVAQAATASGRGWRLRGRSARFNANHPNRAGVSEDGNHRQPSSTPTSSCHTERISTNFLSDFIHCVRAGHEIGVEPSTNPIRQFPMHR